MRTVLGPYVADTESTGSFSISRHFALMIVMSSLLLAGTTAILARLYFDGTRTDARTSLWRLDYRVSFDAQREGDRLQIWLPRDNSHMRIYRQMLNNPDLIPDTPRSTIYQSRLDLIAEEAGEHSILATFEFELGPDVRHTSRSNEPIVPAAETTRWLRSTRTIQATSLVAQNLVNEWKQESALAPDLLQRIFQFCLQDLEKGEEAWQDDAESTLRDQMGTDLGCLKAMVALCRAAQIGARLSSGFEIVADGEVEPVFWVEVLENGIWVPYNPVHGFSQKLPWNWVKVGSDSELVVSTSGGEEVEAEFLLTRLPTHQGLSAGNRHWSSIFDLSRLPSRIHDVLSLMLLLPLGAVVTVFFHTVIGWRTVGIFTPALIALSFILADWRTGVVVFALAISLGMITRSLVEPLRLLMVARLSFMLTLVVIFLVLTVSCLDYFRWTPSADAVLLPIVILTLTIEKIYSSTIEDGAKITAHLMLATVVVSFCCYLLLSWRSIGSLVLRLPEVHCFTLAVLVLLGRYTGYRLTELFRFRDLVIAPVSTSE
ncbi:MAG: hypothetical protein JNL67_20920 [Planctomycetaceae bacterium]|nr:hypothetical protein [Planctomycetaceae bacterium]